MLVFADGRLVGTIGGGCYENDAFWKARESHQTRKPQLVHYELSRRLRAGNRFDLRRSDEVYIEPMEPSPELYVVGAGHVGFHLARLAHEVGFRIHVMDDREKFASRDRFPFAAEVTVEDIPAGSAYRSRRRTLTPSSSREGTRTTSRRCARLRLATFGTSVSSAAARKSRASSTPSSKKASPPDSLTHIHAPIGLDIGAVTPQEIAVSILAELIAVKHGKEGGGCDAMGP